MKQGRRSQCPISYTLDVLGDRWSLLVVRDLAFKGSATFTDLKCAGEGIATNILSDRLKRLEKWEIVQKHPDPDDARKRRYTLTEAGLDLLPLLLEMILWAGDHDPESPISEAYRKRAREDRAGMLADMRARAIQGCSLS